MSCSPVTKITSQVKIEERDTVISLLPPLERVSEVIDPKDSISVLETSLATSTAELRGGKLRHSLENKRDSIKVVTKVKTVEKIVEVTKEVEVPKPYIPLWCWLLLGLNVLVIVIKIKKTVL